MTAFNLLFSYRFFRVCVYLITHTHNNPHRRALLLCVNIYVYILYLSVIHVLTRRSARSHVFGINGVPCAATCWVRVTLLKSSPQIVVAVARLGPTVYGLVSELKTSLER